jgi:putative ubiquitin-RnfH superfamily antitoxin RatB of RatAB toxin-antitoxin module
MASVRIEIVYALATAQEIETVEVQEGASPREAVKASGISARHPELDLSRARLGMFGRELRSDARLRDGDRVEILRPLAMGPMEARRLRARRKRR